MMARLVVSSKRMAASCLINRSMTGDRAGNELQASRNESMKEMEMFEMWPNSSVASGSKAQQCGM